MWWLLLLLVPLFWVFVDVVSGVRAHHFRPTALSLQHGRDDFEVLVPIYGNAKYLENAEYLRPYGASVILCTTSGETEEFYREIYTIADMYDFTVYQSPYSPAATSNKRLTGGTIRDRVIRDALMHAVTMPYAVCIDADTTTAQSLNLLVDELDYRGDDLASIRLVPQKTGPMLVQLQRHEYRLAMKMRFIMPWLISGACHVGRSDALRHIMQCHSLFFQGNDVETGLLGEQLGYRVTHIPFEVNTDVPGTWRAWWRQRLAWSGGEFRLFIANFRYILKHPFLWTYGAIVTIAMFALRWYAIATPTLVLVGVAVLYYVVVLGLHWKHRNWWLLLMPIYALFSSLVITPIGIVWFFVMAIPEKNFGIIRAKERLNV